jgi:F420-dependent oxidoreductase-like protein
MKLSVTLNYSGDVVAAAREVPALEAAGLDCVWVAEGYSVDAATMMGYLAATTTTVEIGSSIVNAFSRTSTLLAMTFAGLDTISHGRANFGIGASGPKVIEGFHGVPYDQPTRRIAETIEVCRMTWRREPVNFHGRTIDIPLPPGEGTGLGTPLKIVNHLDRSTIPIWWAAIMPKSVESAAELADGWIPAFFVPEFSARVWGEALARGMTKRDGSLGELKILAGGSVHLTDDPQEVDRVLDAGRANAALYVGGMGARGKNFYNQLMVSYGWEEEATLIQDLFLDGKKEEAEAAVPRAYLEMGSLVGSVGRVRDRIAAFKTAGVTHLQMMLHGTTEEKVRTVEQMRKLVDE